MKKENVTNNRVASKQSDLYKQLEISIAKHYHCVLSECSKLAWKKRKEKMAIKEKTLN